MVRSLPLAVALALALFEGEALAAPAPLGSPERPLQVVLIPADGGTEDGTRADFLPVFNAVSKTTGLRFKLRVGQSYNAVVEAMCNGSADIAFFGPVAYVEAHQRGCAELLAVAVEKGRSTYYAGIFTRRASQIAKIGDLKGKRVAFGDINSGSSFVFPMAMILQAKLDPVRDLAAIRLTGSHANSLAALTQGQADAAALSFDSFEKAVNQGEISAADVRVVARSMPIPNPPLGMNSRLPNVMKLKLKTAFAGVATAPGVTPDMIRGYGGKKVDRYDTQFPESKYAVASSMMARVNDALKAEILKKASAH
ncbi:MAG: phosphate/phosphite/phosphonate ABC transporter substrate-binding protein [bacterium]|nr:phosphate/phosphite/phosphonate ABC transporter substrate-binding protein [bacterium]